MGNETVMCEKWDSDQDLLKTALDTSRVKLLSSNLRDRIFKFHPNLLYAQVANH